MHKLISLPAKKTESVSFAERFSAYVTSHYGQDPANYSAALSELTQLRDKCLVKPADASDFTLKAVMR